MLLVLGLLAAPSIAGELDAEELLEAYLDAAGVTVSEIYQSDADALERSILIGEAELNQYWVSSRKTTMEGRGSGAAFASLLGFRADSWSLREFRQAGDFGEARVDFLRTQTFSSGNQHTSAMSHVYEMVNTEEGWRIAAFRRVAEEDTDVASGERQPDAVVEGVAGAGPEAVTRAQLDLLQGVPPQELAAAAEKSEHLWQDTREARRSLGRVISVVAAISGYSESSIEWRTSIEKQDSQTATVKAEIVSEGATAFRELVFSLEKTGDQWLLSSAVAKM